MELGIPFSAPGFHDHPAFRAAEAADPRFIEAYAAFVETRSYDPGCLAAARRKIEVCAEVLRRRLEADGAKGACIDISMILSRILNRLGIWNYMAKASLTLEFPPEAGLERQHFWSLDYGNFMAPHTFVAAPPYVVVDLSVKHQIYSGDHADHLPPLVLADEYHPTAWTATDLASNKKRAELAARGLTVDDYLRQCRPEILEVMGRFAPRLVRRRGIAMKYIIVAITASEEDLEQMSGFTPCGMTPLEIFRDEVLPALADDSFAAAGPPDAPQSPATAAGP